MRKNWDEHSMPHQPLPLAYTAGNVYVMQSTIKHLRPFCDKRIPDWFKKAHTDIIGPVLDQKEWPTLNLEWFTEKKGHLE